MNKQTSQPAPQQAGIEEYLFTAMAKARYHRVRAGETLYGISRRYGSKIEELRRLNQLPKEATIYPDQKLLIRRGDSK